MTTQSTENSNEQINMALKAHEKKQLITNNYKELYIRIMLSEIKDQLRKLKSKGYSVGLLQVLVKIAEKFVNNTEDTIGDIKKMSRNLELAKRTVNALRNMCLEIEKSSYLNCDVKFINRLIIKNFKFFFPWDEKTKKLFGMTRSESGVWTSVLNRMAQIPTLGFLAKLTKRTLVQKPYINFLDDEEEADEEKHRAS